MFFAYKTRILNTLAAGLVYIEIEREKCEKQQQKKPRHKIKDSKHEIW